MFGKTYRCDKCGRICADNIVATCEHPAVNRVFGNHICMYCCRKCKHHYLLTVKEYGFCGVQCRYPKGDEL